jgi:acyl carrier protein
MPMSESHGEIIGKVEAIFNDLFKNKAIFHPELTRKAEPKWDSLQHVSLLVALEREFSIRFDPAVIGELGSITAVVDELKKKLNL